MSPVPSSLEVTVEIDGAEVTAGTLRVYERRGQSTTFEYADTYLSDARSFPLDPALPLGSGVFQPPPDKTLFNAFSDSAPDRWGQNLMKRQERDRSAANHDTARTLRPVDFLLGTKDSLRQGALRYRTEDSGLHLASDDAGVPALITLPRLLAATDRFLAGEDTDLQDLINAGGSLGGARPKAAVRNARGVLALAKFPRRDIDEWDVAGWEQVQSELATRAGLRVAPSELATVAGRHVFIVERFDRSGEQRIPFASALTMLEASDMEDHSYLELADAIERNSNQPAADLEEMFRRIAFSVLASNTDDHLRNHAFLHSGRGWNLSPAYDLNPNPESTGRLTLAIDFDDTRADIELVASVAPYFRVSAERAKTIISEVELATRQWQDVANRHGIPAQDLTRVAAAFESPQRAVARAMGDTVAVAVGAGAPFAFENLAAPQVEGASQMTQKQDVPKVVAPTGRSASRVHQLRVTSDRGRLSHRLLRQNPDELVTVCGQRFVPSMAQVTQQPVKQECGRCNESSRS